jgi:hypothetical protein
MVPAVPQGVILDDELRGHGSAVAQRERRRAVELFVREGANRVGGLLAVLSQEIQRLGFRVSPACFAFMSRR